MTFAALTVQNLLEEQSRNPSSSLEERIESAKRRASQVRVKIQQDVVRFVLNMLFSENLLTVGPSKMYMRCIA